MSTRLPEPRRRTRILLILVLVVFVNLPAVHSTWQRWKVERSGVGTTATVVQTEERDGGYWLSFEYPPSVDLGDVEVGRWPAEVDRATWEDARESGEIGVRYLEGRVSAYEVDGQQYHWAGLVTTGIFDAILVVIVLLARRFGRRRRPLPLRVAAIGDVERCAPGGLLEQVEGDLYVVRGEVAAIEGDEVLLDLGDQDVWVILDGHRNPVGYQQPAQVRGRLLP
jgi:hypothetical protein